MIKLGIPPYLECSSKGDKRFSAFFARLKRYNNKSIEEIFQSSKIINGEYNSNWKENKGKKADNQLELNKFYSELWDEYIDDNPELIFVLINASGLSDIFGQEGHCCQAKELWRIRNKMITKPTQSHHVDKYKYRIIVSGTRGYNDYEFFSNVIKAYIRKLNDPSYIFITGKASTGADALIIKYCKEHGKSWLEYPAKWKELDVPNAVIKTNPKGEKYNAVAGHQRNEEMAKVATHLLCFYDGHSKGTEHMIAVAKKYNLYIESIIVDVVKGI